MTINNKKIVAGLLLSLMMILSSPVSASMYWQPKVVNQDPEMTAKKNQRGSGDGSGHGAHSRRGGKKINLHQGEGAEVSLWLPTLEQQLLSHVDTLGNYKIPGTGFNSYHAVVAERKTDGHTETAIRYLYMHGKPSGESPTLVINRNVSKLDIIPDPLPREHWRYQSDKRYNFILSFEGKPLPGMSVDVITTNGSSFKTKSNEKGVISFVLPDDFKNVKAGRRNNKPAEFYFIVNHQPQQHLFTTSYSAPYYVNPSHWKIQWEGFAVMFIGFMGGLVFIGQVNNREKSA